MCNKASVCKGVAVGMMLGMVGGALACHWCHSHKRLLRRQVNLTARKVGHLIENVNDLF